MIRRVAELLIKASHNEALINFLFVFALVIIVLLGRGVYRDYQDLRKPPVKRI